MFPNHEEISSSFPIEQIMNDYVASSNTFFVDGLNGGGAEFGIEENNFCGYGGISTFPDLDATVEESMFIPALESQALQAFQNNQKLFDKKNPSPSFLSNYQGLEPYNNFGTPVENNVLLNGVSSMTGTENQGARNCVRYGEDLISSSVFQEGMSKMNEIPCLDDFDTNQFLSLLEDQEIVLTDKLDEFSANMESDNGYSKESGREI